MRPLWLTRTEPALPSPLEMQLRERGWPLELVPVLEIEYLELSAAEQAGLQQAWAAADAIIACSAHAVEAVARFCPAVGPATGCYAVGGRTARQFARRFGGTVQTPLQGHGGQALLQSHPMLAQPGHRVLVLQGEEGMQDWQQTLVAGGALVQAVSLYRRRPRACALPARPPRAIIASSGAALQALTALVAGNPTLLGSPLLVPREGLLPIARSLSWSGRIAAMKTFSAVAVEEALNRRDPSP